MPGPAESPGSRRSSLLGVVDFEGVAGLIDTVAASAPGRLETLLRALFSSDERLEARVVVELAWRCRDPLAPLGSLCRDALRVAADLDLLLRRPWWKLEEIRPHARANALLHLCDASLAQDNPYAGERRRLIRQIRPRLKVAARAESRDRKAEIERLQRLREVTLPDLWSLLERYVGARIRHHS